MTTTPEAEKATEPDDLVQVPRREFERLSGIANEYGSTISVVALLAERLQLQQRGRPVKLPIDALDHTPDLNAYREGGFVVIQVTRRPEQGLAPL